MSVPATKYQTAPVRQMHRRSVAALQVVLTLLLIHTALLVVIPAQTTFYWKLSLVAREMGHVIATAAAVLVTLQCAVPRLRRTRTQRTSVLLQSLSVVVLLLPAYSAGLSVRRMENSLSTSRPRLEVDRLFTPAAASAVPARTPVVRAPTGEPLPVDVYSVADSARPLVVFIYGGSWRGGDRSALPELGWLLAREGYAVAALSYRLAPKHPYPAALDDVRAALQLLRDSARAFGIDTSRVVLAGRSAGGHLALLAAYLDPQIRGVIALYAPTDLRWGWDHPANPRVIDTRGVLSDFLGGPPERTGTRYDDASPIRWVSAATPPTLLVHGSRDELVSPEHSRRLAARLRSAARAHRYVELPWATHGCDYFINGLCGQILTHLVRQFLQESLQRPEFADRRKTGTHPAFVMGGRGARPSPQRGDPAPDPEI